MFIGSVPRSSLGSGAGTSMNDAEGGIGGMVTKTNNNAYTADGASYDDPPFRNPTTLQQPAADVTSSTLSGPGNSLLPATSQQIPYQMQNSGAAGNASAANVNAMSAAVQGRDTLLPPLTSLDALASSPFRLAASQNVPGAANLSGAVLSSSPGASAFSSLMMGKGSAAYGPLDEGFPLALTSGGASGNAFNSSSLMPGRWGSEFMHRSSCIGNEMEKEDDGDDMPFAVELDDFPNPSNLGVGGTSVGSTPKVSRHNSAADMQMGSSSGTMSSQVVTSLAHRCSTAGRLKLFGAAENQNQDNTQSNSACDKSIMEESITSLTNQLNHFRSFGNSITASGLLPPANR